jgi:hypothetical protein
MRGPKRTVEVLTGEILPVSFKDMETRVNFIRNRSRALPPRYTIDQEVNALNRTEEVVPERQSFLDLETDQLSTNFNPKKPEVIVRAATKSFSRSGKPQGKTVPALFDTEKKRPLTSYKRAVRVTKVSLTEGKLHG